MAYDRYHEGRERDWRGSDRDQRNRGRDDERGWFERAGDEVSSWFGGDDRDRGRGRGGDWHRREEHRQQESGWFGDDRDRDRGYGRDYDRDREQSNWRGNDRDSARPMRWTSSNSDYRSGYDRDDARGHESSWSGRDRGDERAFGSRYSGGGYGGGRDDDDRGRDYRPMAGDYGRTGGYDRSQSEWGRDDYRRTSYAGSTASDDHHYRAWRDRQAEELDRDYQDYCRERGERFESDFGSWRNERQQQRERVGRIREHMDVVGNDGERVGKVDCVRGDRVILTKNDSEDGHHHSIGCSMIESIESDQVRLNVSASQAKDRWRDEDRERALFEDRDRGGDGPHNLERSFHGTYK